MIISFSLRTMSCALLSRMLTIEARVIRARLCSSGMVADPQFTIALRILSSAATRAGTRSWWSRVMMPAPTTRRLPLSTLGRIFLVLIAEANGTLSLMAEGSGV